jgi:hypothetical protein
MSEQIRDALLEKIADIVDEKFPIDRARAFDAAKEILELPEISAVLAAAEAYQ